MHGHYALIYLYDAAMLPAFRDAYAWLITEARKHRPKAPECGDGGRCHFPNF